MFVDILLCNPENLRQLSKIPVKQLKTTNIGKIEGPDRSRKYSNLDMNV